MMMIDEVWKRVKKVHRLDKSTGLIEKTYIIRNGYEYKVSNKGNVIRRSSNNYEWKPISTSTNRHGYRVCHIQVEGKNKPLNVAVHRLVAEKFLHKPKDHKKRWVNHIDGDKSNPDFSNLEWATRSDNAQHALTTGLLAVGERSGHAKMNDKDVHLICEYLERGLSPSQIEKTISLPHISKKNISKIRSGSRWTHISSQYDFSKNSKDDFKKGEGRPSSKLNEETVHLICQELALKTPVNKIVKKLNLDVSQSSIVNIKTGKSWSYISKLYKI
jgi:hypothetical protein